MTLFLIKCTQVQNKKFACSNMFNAVSRNGRNSISEHYS